MATSADVDVLLIKKEREEGAEPDIKPKLEPDVLSPGVQSEEDVYEDAGDLDFTNSRHNVYLTRLPKFLWTSWSQMDDDAEIQLGTMRVEGDLEHPKRVCCRLSLWFNIN